MKTALTCGVAGQCGAYLSQRLLHKGYGVCGTSRDAQISSLAKEKLGWEARYQLPDIIKMMIQAKTLSNS